VRDGGLTDLDRRASIGPVVQQPRQIYASTADRRHGRRWTRRHRSSMYWLPGAVLTLAVLEALRSLA
jgi:hypothetical protein